MSNYKVDLCNVDDFVIYFGVQFQSTCGSRVFICLPMKGFSMTGFGSALYLGEKGYCIRHVRLLQLTHACGKRFLP